MRVRLKNVFVVYFLVSVTGLLYALMQLGERGGRPSSQLGGMGALQLQEPGGGAAGDLGTPP